MTHQAQQLPGGYLPFVIGATFATNSSQYHDTQILTLRLAGYSLLLGLAFAWAFLVSMATNSWLSAAAASALMGLNPLVHQSFTYVTNDGAAIVIGTIAFGYIFLRSNFPESSLAKKWAWLSPTIGVLIGLTKFTAALVVIPAVIAAAIVRPQDDSQRGRNATPLIYSSVLIIGVAALTNLLFGGWQALRSQKSASEVLATLMPPRPSSIGQQAVTRLGDFDSLIFGAGVYPITIYTAIFSIFGMAVTLLALKVSSWSTVRATPLLRPDSLVVGAILTVIFFLLLFPLAETLRSGLGTTFIGRYLAPLVPVLLLASLPVFDRRKSLAKVLVALSFPLAMIGTNSMSLIAWNLTSFWQRLT